jgi:hypothetical protein
MDFDPAELKAAREEIRKGRLPAGGRTRDHNHFRGVLLVDLIRDLDDLRIEIELAVVN